MAVRTTDAAVALIIEQDVSISLTSFIEVANALVTELCTDSGYDATRLELIERWLSAHFYAIRDPRTVSEKADVVAQSFRSKVDLGFNVTHYGQMAMRIDTDGNLAALDKRTLEGQRKSLGVSWVGLSETEQGDGRETVLD
jgi:hypothetical protein